MRKIIFFMVILLSLVLVTAVVETDQSIYSSGEIVKVSGTCISSGPVALQAAIGANSVWFEQAYAGNSFSVDFLPSQDGTYTLYAACYNKVAESTSFCVGEGCEDESEDEVSESNDASSDSGGEVITLSCNEYNLPSCTQTTCAENGLYWYEGSCHKESQVVELDEPEPEAEVIEVLPNDDEELIIPEEHLTGEQFLPTWVFWVLGAVILMMVAVIGMGVIALIVVLFSPKKGKVKKAEGKK